MSSPFADPASASGVKWEDHNGALLLITPHTVETGVNTSFGSKDAVRADVAVLDGAHAGEEYPDVLIFPGVLIGQLRSQLGKKVIGRLGQGVGKPGQKPPWKLIEATDADKQIGMAYLNKTQLATPAPAGSSGPPF